MSIAPKLVMRQSQSLFITPQLLQAIRLLQLSAPDLQSFVESELERNPLLDRAVSIQDSPVTPSTPVEIEALQAPGDWAGQEIPTDLATLERETGTQFENVFPDEAIADQSASQRDSLFWNNGREGGAGNSFDPDDPNLEAFCAASTTLHEHLEKQLGCTDTDDLTRNIASIIINDIDQTGYFTGKLEDLASRLSVPLSRCELALEVIQGFEPTGIGARSLAECLRLQLIENGKFDQFMVILLGNLELIAKRELSKLRKLCGVDEEDLAEMLSEIRALDPKPGLCFSSFEKSEVVTPDVFVRPSHDGAWKVELNSDALPKVIANTGFYSMIVKKTNKKEKVHGKEAVKEEKTFVEEAWASANWLVRSLEQRANTILKVAAEVVKHQDDFFNRGVAYLRPLNLKIIAEAISLHESTISRVTMNKYISTPRGVFEMKYFFSTGINSMEGEEQVSSEAVRFRIKELIENEGIGNILSDDALADKLKNMGIDIARRTVAKYREGMGIPSSSIRKRERINATPHAKTG